MDALLQQGWLSRCPPDFQQAVLERGKAQRYAARDFVFHLGDAPAGIYGIVAGTFGVTAAPERNVPRLSLLLYPGAWFGEGPLMTGQRRRVAAQAHTAGEVIYLSIEEVNALCEAAPARHRLFGMLAFENLAVAANIVTDLQLRRSEARLAAALLRAAGRTVLTLDRALFPVRLSQAELGEIANVSRQVVNGTLRRWQAAGWIDVRYGEVVVHNLERLLECTAD